MGNQRYGADVMNAMDAGVVNNSYLQSIFSLLDRVEYRRITTQSDMVEIERLRRNSYEGKLLTDVDSFGALVDADDFADDCYVIGVYVDEQLVSTIRLHVVTAHRLHGPAASHFTDVTMGLLQNGATIIDPSRFATDPMSLWKYPAIPLLTLRAAAMALEYFSASNLVGVVRDDGASFYKRCFGGAAVSDPIWVTGVVVPVLMLACPVGDIETKIATRYPFFKSKEFERKLMFAPRDQLAYPSLNILPTAKYAHTSASTLAASTYPQVMPA